MEDKDKILYDLLTEVREDQKEHGKELVKQSVYLSNMEVDVKELKETVTINTEDIAHHIKRTDLLQDLHTDNQRKIELVEKRLESLEEPIKAKAWIQKHMLGLISLITAIMSIIALLVEMRSK